MSGFPVHSDGQCAISLWFNNGVQEGDGPILLVVFDCKLYDRVNTINVLKEALFVDLSCSKKKRTISGRLSLNADIPNGLWTRWRKDLTSPPDRLLMGAPQVPNLSPMKLKTKVTLSYPTHKVFVKASKRSVVHMASKPTSKVTEPSRAFWSPQGLRPYGQPKWCHLLVPMW